MNPFLVVVRENPLTGCWDCVSHRPGDNGYPLVKVGGRPMALHRFMYMRHNPGRAPDVVRHTCDNRLCCNPGHLAPGTHADNVADRVARGRSASGRRNGRAKLTEEQVAEIIGDGGRTSNLEFARRFGVDPKCVWSIRNGRNWLTLRRKLAGAS